MSPAWRGAVMALLAAGLSAAAPPPPPDAGAPAVVPPRPARPSPPSRGGSCVGHWVGAGQNTGGAPWTIDMTVDAAPGARCGLIEYPSLGCGGYLEACTVDASGRVHFVERYTHNPGTCAPPGTIDATCAGDTMHWSENSWEIVRTLLHRS